MSGLPDAWRDYVSVVSKRPDVDKDKLISITIRELQKSDIHSIVNLDFGVLESIVSKAVGYLSLETFTYKELRKFQRLGSLSLRVGIPDIFFANLYENLKSQLRNEDKELLDRLDKAFRALISPYIANYMFQEESIANIDKANLAVIKTLEEAKRVHLRYVKKFFRSMLDGVPFDLPLYAKDCDFNRYMERLSFLKQEKLYSLILRNHEDLHKAVKYTIKVANKSFSDFYMAVKEVDRCSTRLLENLDTLLMSYLAHITVYDPLTGLFNRNYMGFALNREANRSRRYSTPLSLVMIDIDNFKLINDTYGHLVGDEVLRWVGCILKRHARSTDIPVRYGGEEFLIILPHTDVLGARTVAEKLRAALKQSEVSVSNLKLRITVSAGVVQVKNFDDPMEDVDRADRAMYMAKRQGKDRVVVLEDG